MRTISITVEGRVQGVYYRQSTLHKAMELGLTGQVRNLPDGRVEVLATGSDEALNQLYDWCGLGPPKAFVTRINKNELPLQEFQGFKIAH